MKFHRLAQFLSGTLWLLLNAEMLLFLNIYIIGGAYQLQQYLWLQILITLSLRSFFFSRKPPHQCSHLTIQLSKIELVIFHCHFVRAFLKYGHNEPKIDNYIICLSF